MADRGSTQMIGCAFSIWPWGYCVERSGFFCWLKKYWRIVSLIRSCVRESAGYERQYYPLVVCRLQQTSHFSFSTVRGLAFTFTRSRRQKWVELSHVSCAAVGREDSIPTYKSLILRRKNDLPLQCCGNTHFLPFKCQLYFCIVLCHWLTWRFRVDSCRSFWIGHLDWCRGPVASWRPRVLAELTAAVVPVYISNYISITSTNKYVLQ